MNEFSIDVLGIIKTMFLRSISNHNAVEYITNNLLAAYKTIILTIFSGIILRFLIKFTYKLIKKIKEKIVKKEELSIKQAVKESFLTEKSIFKNLKYPIIGSILVGTSWLQVSVVFWLFSSYYKTQGNIIRETLSEQENQVLGMWSIYSLLIFIIAGCFIGLSFGNKTLRNIGIIIYALGVLFILFGFFLDNGAIINDLPNFTV